MMYWLMEATGSASLMGLVMMVSHLPAGILGPIAGTFADRHSRRTIIVVTDLIRGVLVIALAALFFLRPDSTDLLVVGLFVAGGLLATAGSFFQPAVSAAIPDLVPADKLPQANALNQMSMQLSTFLGQGTGGVLFRLLGAPVLFLIDGISYVFSAISELFIQIPQKLPAKSSDPAVSTFQQFKIDTKEGFAFVWRDRGLRHLFFAAAALNFFAMPILVLLPFYVADFLNATADWYGFLLAAAGLGSMIGFGLFGWLKLDGRRRSITMVAALLLLSGTFAALGLLSSRWSALALLIGTGLTSGFFNVGIATILQATTPSEIRGRVFGLLGTLSMALMPISMGLAGFVADAMDHNIPLIYLACGTATLLAATVLTMSTDFRAFMAFNIADTAVSQEKSAGLTETGPAD